MSNVKIRILSESKGDIDKIAKVVIFNDKHEILFIKRTDYDSKHAGELDLPGGHFKEKESDIDALRREVEEETGIKLQNPIPLEKEGKFSYFIAKYNNDSNDSIKLSKEHDKYLFIPVKDFEKHENLRGKFKRVAKDASKRFKNAK